MMSFFASRKLKNKLLKIDLNNKELDKPLTARQVLEMLLLASEATSLETAVLQRSKPEQIPESIRHFFIEVEM